MSPRRVVHSLEEPQNKNNSSQLKHEKPPNVLFIWPVDTSHLSNQYRGRFKLFVLTF